VIAATREAAFLLWQRGFGVDLEAMLSGRRPAHRTRSTRLLEETKGDDVIHVEVKGKRKGTRRERRAKR
jgi:hypothetical protein